MSILENRRILWFSKFAYPEINTRKTRIYLVPRKFREVYFPDQEKVELKKFGYKSKKHIAFIRIAYREKDDTLVVSDGSFSCEKLKSTPKYRERKTDLIDAVLRHWEKE